MRRWAMRIWIVVYEDVQIVLSQFHNLGYFVYALTVQSINTEHVTFGKMIGRRASRPRFHTITVTLLEVINWFVVETFVAICFVQVSVHCRRLSFPCA